MAKAPALYLAVLKASYDYAPQSEDEIAIKEDQLLYLVERTDEEYVGLCSWVDFTYSFRTLVGGRSRSRVNLRRMMKDLPVLYQQPM